MMLNQATASTDFLAVSGFGLSLIVPSFTLGCLAERVGITHHCSG
jgi:hypothetical protein